ncbi:MAG TPA: Crp/Fnr family transcriptional regulator [Bryobacteraceae bacterium]|nr:Crp/Fnr family transcriptional regulator [Bryobacteraceae bacterium]HTS29716.1 Crp/Fnr family transcriptional regulator [Bryobacteraceae bacterium]
MNRTISTEPHVDPTAFLPRKPVQEFPRKHTIYGPGEACDHIYAVRSGRVVLTSAFDSAAPSVTRIVGPKGIFGEAMLVGTCDPSESAVTLDRTSVMSWSRAEIEQQMMRDARLANALLGYFVIRCAELAERVEALAFYRTPERVMLGLLQLAENLGTPASGAMRLAPLTHRIIAEYVGTSRELVTFHMCEFRRAGLLQYSRSFIDANVGLMRKTLENGGFVHSATETPMVQSAV